MKKLILILTFSLIILNAESQSELWECFSASECITDIAVDQNDIWIGTRGGICRFNKISYSKTFYNNCNSEINFNHIYTIAIDSIGNKWFGGSVRISKLEGDEWTNFNSTVTGITGDINIIAIDANNKKWFGTSWGLFSYNDTIWRQHEYSSGFSVYGLVFDDNNNLWLTTSIGLMSYANDKWTRYSDTDINYHSNSLQELIFDANGTLWVASSIGLLRFDGIGLDTTELYSENFDFTSIIIDNQNNKWIGGCNNSGIYSFTNDTTWANFSTNTSNLPSNCITSIELDNQGNIWIGTCDSLSIFNGENWTNYNISNTKLPDNEINDIEFDNYGNLWIGTGEISGGGGLVKYLNDEYTIFNTYNSELSSNHIECITIDSKNSVWVGNYGSGVNKITDSNTVKYYYPEIPDNNIRVIRVDKYDNIWIGTIFGGVAVYNGQEWTNYSIENSGLPSNRISDIQFEDDIAWIATDSGLVKFENDIWLTYNEENSNIPDNKVQAISIDLEGNKWLGIANIGVVKFSNNDWITYYTKELSFGYISDIQIDNCNTIWIGTWGGLGRFESGNWEVYNGWNSPVINSVINTLCVDSSGAVFIGTDGSGLFKYNRDCSTLYTVKKPIKKNDFLNLKVYPNPNLNYLITQFNVIDNSEINLKIYDLNGRTLIDKYLGYKVSGIYEEKIIIESFPNGIYFLSIKTDFTENIIKIVK